MSPRHETEERGFYLEYSLPIPGSPPPTAARLGRPVPETSPGTARHNTGTGTIGTMTTAAADGNSKRVELRMVFRLRGSPTFEEASAAASCAAAVRYRQ